MWTFPPVIIGLAVLAYFAVSPLCALYWAYVYRHYLRGYPSPLEAAMVSLVWPATLFITVSTHLVAVVGIRYGWVRKPKYEG